jgi:hypothetical protein
MYQGVYMIIDTYPKIGGGFSILKVMFVNYNSI